MPYGQDELTGWEARQRGLVDTALDRYLRDFMAGGQYAPERLNALFEQSYGRGIPTISAPSARAGDPYGRQVASGAMGLASRSAAIQAGSAAQGLGGLSPAARVAALSQISRSAAGNVGAIGANAYTQGYGQGMGLLQNTNLANQNAQMQARMGALGLFEGGVGRAYGAGAAGAQSLIEGIRDYWQRRDAAKREKDKAAGEAIGGVFSMAADYLSGGAAGLQGSPGVPYELPGMV